MHYRYKYGFLIVIFILLKTTVSAQDTFSYEAVEKTSLRLYQQNSWDSLAAYCDAAIDQGYDYYYLRVRAGIARFKKLQYRNAIPHFEKALSLNANDDLANNYLYFCYIYSGQYEAARWLAKNFDSTFCSSIGAGNLQPLSLVSAEAGARISSKPDAFKTGIYVQAALSHFVLKRFSLFHALTYYQQNEKRYDIRQFQYYLKAAVPLRNRWLLSGGAQVLYNNNISADTIIVGGQQGGSPGGPGGPGGQQLPPHKITEQNSHIIFGTAVAISVMKSMTHLDLGGGISALFLDSVKQYQVNGTLIYYPFANNLLGIGGNIYMHTTDNFNTNNFSFAPQLSLHLKSWSFTASYLNNAKNNAIEYTAYLVNNSEDLSPQRYSLIISRVLTKKTNIYGVYNYETKTLKGKNSNYNYNAFIVGIRFTPY